jgi:hypothetical protein
VGIEREGRKRWAIRECLDFGESNDIGGYLRFFIYLLVTEKSAA